MAYTNTDYSFWTNPKVRAAGKDAAFLYIAGNGFCNEFLTDGFISDTDIEAVAFNAFTRNPKKAIEALIVAGLWDRVPGGYKVHDYLDYNKSKKEIEELRSKKAAAGRKGGQARAQAPAQAYAIAPASAHAQAPAKQYIYDSISNLKDTTTPPYPPESDPKFEALFSAYEKQFGKSPRVDSEEIAVVAEMINDGISEAEFIAAIREMDEKGYSCPAISSARQWIMNNRMKTERKAKAKSRIPAREVPDRYHIPGYVPDTSNEIVIHD